MKAIWNGVILAESETTEQVEGNAYFPPDSLKQEHFRHSEHTTVCPWKGTANYYDIDAGGEVNKNAAWYYPETSAKAANIKGYVAFWKGVVVK